MTNANVARVFNQLADFMEIAGEDSFRVSSYRRVARTLDDLGEEITAIAERGELQELPGVGKASAEKIDVLLRTGRLPQLEELKKVVPPTLLDLLALPAWGRRRPHCYGKNAASRRSRNCATRSTPTRSKA